MAETGKREVAVKGITPAGIAVYPWLNKPDTKHKAEGSYKVSLRLTKEDAEALIEKLTPHHEAAVEAGKTAFKSNPKNKGKQPPPVWPLYTEVFDADGNETGLLEFKFKRTASGVSKKNGKPWAIKPDLFGRSGKPLPADVAIYGGSKIKVAYEAVPYAAKVGIGLSLALNAVQVIDLVSSMRNADSYGFGNEGEDEESDGFSDESGAAAEGEGGDEDGEGDDF
jgi:hypothetical protein